jgi:hypothetical protein
MMRLLGVRGEINLSHRVNGQVDSDRAKKRLFAKATDCCQPILLRAGNAASALRHQLAHNRTRRGVHPFMFPIEIWDVFCNEQNLQDEQD